MYCSDRLSLENDKKLRQWKPNKQLAEKKLYYFSPSYNELYEHTKGDLYIR